MKLLPRILACALIACLTWTVAPSALASHAIGPSLSFGVINLRSAYMTAQYWNPILRYVSQRSGVPLKLRIAKSGPEHAAMIRRGELDFIYSNYQFAPGNDTVGYTAIARPLGESIRSLIIVPAGSAIDSLDQLRGRVVAFPSKVAFAGYHVPMDALLRAGIQIKPQFVGTIEATLGRVLSGQVPAAAVGATIARDYAERQHAAYRVLWSSEEYPAIPVAAHPAVPKDKVEAVRAALLAMADDPKGREILAFSAPLFGYPPNTGFVSAGEVDYDPMRRFYKYRLAPQDTR